MFTERHEPVMLVNTCWYLCFPVLCALPYVKPLFCKLPLGIISFDFLYDSFIHALPLLSFSGLVCFFADPLHNQPSLESAIFGISHAACAGARDNTQMRY